MSKFLYLCSLVMILSNIYGMREEDPNENLKRELDQQATAICNFENGTKDIDEATLRSSYNAFIKLIELDIADAEDEITQFKPELMWGDEDGFTYIDENGIERSNPDPEGCYNSLWGCELILTKLSSNGEVGKKLHETFGWKLSDFKETLEKIEKLKQICYDAM